MFILSSSCDSTSSMCSMTLFSLIYSIYSMWPSSSRTLLLIMSRSSDSFLTVDSCITSFSMSSSEDLASRTIAFGLLLSINLKTLSYMVFRWFLGLSPLPLDFHHFPSLLRIRVLRYKLATSRNDEDEFKYNIWCWYDRVIILVRYITNLHNVKSTRCTMCNYFLLKRSLKKWRI